MLSEPAALVTVVVSCWLYWRGVRIVWRRAGARHVVTLRQVASFGAGLLAILVALESPLDTLSADLFAAHMVQHLLLILVAGPLLVLGEPFVPMLWALPEKSRTVVGAALRRLLLLRHPLMAFGLHSGALWLWHVPLLYETALASRGVHIVEHASFLLTAVLFWWTILHRAQHAYGVAVGYVFALALQSSILGGLLAFSPTPWYAVHLNTTHALGLSPLEDQQLAGLIMWVPGGLVYLGAGLGLLLVWLRPAVQPDHTPDRAAHTSVHR